MCTADGIDCFADVIDFIVLANQIISTARIALICMPESFRECWTCHLFMEQTQEDLFPSIVSELCLQPKLLLMMPHGQGMHGTNLSDMSDWKSSTELFAAC
jgi:hypothetical protein